jgi:hypothetical protein
MSTRYHFDESVFEQLDKNSAYWLGVIYSDGCMHFNLRHKCWELQFGSIDKEFVLDFQKFLRTDAPVYSLRKKRFYTMVIRNQKICKNLMAFGVISRKSLVLTFPTFIPPYLVRHFIRGYFDGDGHASLDTGGRMRLGFSGTFSLVSGIQNFLVQELKIKKTKIFPNNSIFCLSVNDRNDIVSVRDFLYQGAEYFLLRKRLVLQKASPKNLGGVYYNARRNTWRVLYYSPNRKEKTFHTKERAEQFYSEISLRLAS